GGIAERKAMIDREHDLPIARQAEALNISGGSVYYLPRPVPDADLAVMRRLLTASPPIKPTSTRCPSAWQPTTAEAPLIDAENLFRQPGPLQLELSKSTP